MAERSQTLHRVGGGGLHCGRELPEGHQGVDVASGDPAGVGAHDPTREPVKLAVVHCPAGTLAPRAGAVVCGHGADSFQDKRFGAGHGQAEPHGVGRSTAAKLEREVR